MLAESQRKLEEKAELYEKFQRGELQYDEEESNVDFLMKDREEGKVGRSSGDVTGPGLPKRGVGVTSTSGNSFTVGQALQAHKCCLGMQVEGVFSCYSRMVKVCSALPYLQTK